MAELFDELESYFLAQGGFGDSFANSFVQRIIKQRRKNISFAQAEVIRQLHHQYIKQPNWLG